ncbi:hypothetical protein SDC9_48642 [bioreactor metagenome]|uniref:HNH domain-containing protein n=1 Tax=bioreactor metagenome TaxID=1076179 RepID=A0A644WJG6_9ZZZZ
MRILKPLEVDAEEVFNETIKNKSVENQIILNSLKELVFYRYKTYENNKLELGKINNPIVLDKNKKDTLINCYSRDSKYYIGKLTAEIISKQDVHVQSNCPCCGLSSPDTIDHYLPKTEFPEYSILPINLIPSCGTCNNLKKSNWRDGINRQYLNFYFDSFIKQKFLYAYITFDAINKNYPSVSFKLEKPNLISEKEFEIVKSHYEKLNLFKRCESHAVSEISNVYTEISMGKEIDIKIHKNTLLRRVNVYKRNYGVNNWRTCLYEALANSDEFLSTCIS